MSWTVRPAYLFSVSSAGVAARTFDPCLTGQRRPGEVYRACGTPPGSIVSLAFHFSQLMQFPVETKYTMTTTMTKQGANAVLAVSRRERAIPAHVLTEALTALEEAAHAATNAAERALSVADALDEALVLSPARCFAMAYAPIHASPALRASTH